jgi:hypothetical protein
MNKTLLVNCWVPLGGHVKPHTAGGIEGGSWGSPSCNMRVTTPGSWWRFVGGAARAYVAGGGSRAGGVQIWCVLNAVIAAL